MIEEDRRMAAYIAEVMRKVAHYGFTVQGVFATADSPGPSFCYTVGLSQYDAHPELLVYGIPIERAAFPLLSALANRVKEGERFFHGQRIEGQLGPDYEYPVTLILAEDDSDLTMARLANELENWTAGQGDIAALQVVWTDFEGRFPWDPGYDVDERIQPLRGPKPA